MISRIDLSSFLRLVPNLRHFSAFHLDQFNKSSNVSVSVRSAMETSIVREDKMNAILSNTVLHPSRSLDRISFVHRRILVFLSFFTVGKMFIDVQLDLMMNCGVNVKIDRRIVSMGMISFVLMVNV